MKKNKLNISISVPNESKDTLNLIKDCLIELLRDMGVSSPDVEFDSKLQLYYTVENHGDDSLVELYYQEDDILKDTGYSFRMPSNLLGTTAGADHISYEITSILEQQNELNMYRDEYMESIISFENLPEEIKEMIAIYLDDTITGMGTALQELDAVGMTADPGLDGSLGFFRFRK